MASVVAELHLHLVVVVAVGVEFPGCSSQVPHSPSQVLVAAAAAVAQTPRADLAVDSQSLAF